MASSTLTAAKRAFVKVLLWLAVQYSVSLKINRDSPDPDLVSAYRRVALRAHPDKGGNKKDFQKLQGAKQDWEDAKKGSNPSGGRPPHPQTETLVPNGFAKTGFRVNCEAVLLTYSGNNDGNPDRF